LGSDFEFDVSGNMRDHMTAYPGKVLQYPRNLFLESREKRATNPNNSLRSHPNTSLRLHPHTSLRLHPHTSLKLHPHSSLIPLHPYTSLEELSSFSQSKKSKRKPNLSLKLVRRLSRLLSPNKDECEQFRLEFDPVDVHIPTRSKSLDGERRYLSLSRKQILASLQEEEPSFKVRSMLEPFSTFPTCIGELNELWENNSSDETVDINSSDETVDINSSDTSSDERVDTSSESSSESGSYPGDRFSRCQLIQTLEHQEDRTDQAPTSDLVDTNDNKQQADLKCDNEQYADCDNKTSPAVSELQLQDLSWVGTLGIGGFGRVELVTAGENNNLTFALKKMKKIEIKDDKQQQHIINEKNIMLSCSSPFIVQLYRTFRDPRYLYMLMEPCLGGELWSILRDKKRFDDDSSRFYTACVIKAFEYLHDKGIVYRDLKPENLLLDASGYVKLTDFGFSKKLEPGEKSWTFCGTPEYVAPEIITNKSHDHRADIWSVGILMYELLNGIPPFSKRNQTSSQVYTDILKGMKVVNFPSYMSSTSVELIRQLCRLSPVQRPSLSVTRRYMWFAGMNWEGLENRTMTPPFLPKITGAKDTSNFDNYGEEAAEPEEDFSEWDLLF